MHKDQWASIQQSVKRVAVGSMTGVRIPTNARGFLLCRTWTLAVRCTKPPGQCMLGTPRVVRRPKCEAGQTLPSRTEIIHAIHLISLSGNKNLWCRILGELETVLCNLVLCIYIRIVAGPTEVLHTSVYRWRMQFSQNDKTFHNRSISSKLNKKNSSTSNL
jgi:hypothetical protein